MQNRVKTESSCSAKITRYAITPSTDGYNNHQDRLDEIKAFSLLMLWASSITFATTEQKLDATMPSVQSSETRNVNVLQGEWHFYKDRLLEPNQFHMHEYQTVTVPSKWSRLSSIERRTTFEGQARK